MTSHAARALILAFAVALAACSPVPAAAPTQPAASATPLPPTATSAPTPPPTEAPVTAQFGGVIVYAYAEPFAGGVQVTLVRDGEPAELQIVTDWRPGLLALAPDGAHAALELDRENRAQLYWLDFSAEPAVAIELGSLPGQSAVKQITFAAALNAFAVTYDANFYGANPDLRTRLFHTADLAFTDVAGCGGVYAFSADSIELYCSTAGASGNVPEPFAYNLENAARSSFFDISPSKQSIEVGQIWFPAAMHPLHNQVLWTSFASYHLDTDLVSKLALTSWTSEDIQAIAELPMVIAFSSFPRLQRLAWSPDGSRIMLAGVAGASSTNGAACMSDDHYTGVASLQQPYLQPGGEDAANRVFGFAWSPDQQGLLAMLKHGEQCSLSIVDAGSFEELAVIGDLSAATLRSSVILGVDALWLP